MGNATDILVVGGGPAGLTGGNRCAKKRGFSVTIADGAEPPIDRACGGGLLPGTLAALRETWRPHAERRRADLPRIRFIDGSILAEAECTGEGAIGVRRTVLHQKMVERAKEWVFDCCGSLRQRPSLPMGSCKVDRRRTEFIRVSGPGAAWRQASTAKCGVCAEEALSRGAFA